jgi:hypothetical protein
MGGVNQLAGVHYLCTVHVIVNNANTMNIDRMPPREVEGLFIARFRELISEAIPKSEVEIVPQAPNAGVDFIVRAKAPSGPEFEFLIECKLNPRPSLMASLPAVSVERVFNQDGTVRRARLWVFAAPFVSPRLAEVCWDRNWGWFDLAGNYRIGVPGLLYLDCKGNQPVHRASRPEANLGSPEAARILRALLMNDAKAVRWASQRALQEATEPEVSLGLVNKIVSHLRGEGHLAADGKEGIRVVDPEKLLFAWRDAYRFDRVPRAEWFTLLKGSDIEKALREMNREHAPCVAWAAFSAAERQAPMVRQPKFWLIALDDQVDRLREALQAKPVESGSNLTVLVAPDRGYLAGAKDEDNAGVCTHPLQTYVDTWHAGGRGEEAAQAVLDRRLKPSWKHTVAP